MFLAEACRLLQSTLSPFWVTSASDPGIYPQIKSLAVPRLRRRHLVAVAVWEFSTDQISILPTHMSVVAYLPFQGYLSGTFEVFCQYYVNRV